MLFELCFYKQHKAIYSVEGGVSGEGGIWWGAKIPSPERL